MTHISISKLKENPSKAIDLASEYPVAVENRNKVQAYLIGENLYEKLILFVEDYLDSQTVKSTDFSKSKSFEKIAEELGI